MAVITNALRYPEQMPDMARALGVNLSRAVSDRKLRNFQRHDMAYLCSTCMDKLDCKAWLAGSGENVERAPDFCPNKFRFAALKS